MGTRGLHGVVIDGALKTAYNHFDSYPSALGVTMLADAQKLADLAPEEFERVRQAWRKVVLVDEVASPTPEQRLVLEDKGLDPKGQWYGILREYQGSLDSYLGAGFMLDSKEFGYDSLFCEWAWVIDLDARTFEAYEGFQKITHTEGRWAVGVKLIAKWAFDELPSEDDFLAQTEPKNEEN